MVSLKGFVFLVWFSFGLGSVLYGVIAIAYERVLVFKEPIPDKALPGHVMRTEQVPNEGSCRVKCYLEPNCVSINVGPSTEGKHTCDLNNHTDESPSHSSLEKREHYIHYAVENFCHGDPCPGNVSVCQVGFTSKGYRCACRAGYTARGDHGQCEDIDECARGTHKCSDDAVCNNTKGGYNCTCKPGFEGDGQNCQVYPKNCAKVYQSGNKISGVYKIDPDGLGGFEVFCDQTTAGGGWTVFQKRFDGSVDFYRGWDDYKRGFGNLTGEFWLGLDKINRLTVSSNNKLRVDLEDSQRNKIFTEYNTFVVGNEMEKYKLTLREGSTGTAKDSLSYHNGVPFTTKDQDNDRSSTNCATQLKGAWWYKKCATSNLNGLYIPGRNRRQGMSWYSWKNNHVPMRKSQMKLRSKPF